ncbi:ribonuclease HII [Microbacterium testaceum]|uniref:Ribonuclease n=1 Tax=Microbacterium testaceum TaxID=2033 RepID=A0A4Y3QPV3_MICTE|nr:ribonuclease HII [Microbacterium testaceum]MDZ5145351.1 ribonuclease HII [Microbacterium testaceum]WJS89509.1 ribonuclease HII [Microbacterium testaceum]GEB47202.1 ribonuclease [Microbacterium testaceum]
MIEPTLTLERRLLKEHAIVIACDEVGRGALAGPVAVGAAVIDPARSRKRVPQGLRDSKLVPEARRPEVAARAAAFVQHSAVGWASSVEVDEIGIIRALGLAAVRAIADLRAHGVVPEEALVILDGNHDYITPAGESGLTVRPIIKADRDCASAAAASVIAKVARDTLMTGLHDDHPAYGWARNKGYASLDHRDAISAHGMSVHHRHSWAIAAAPTLF